jgi:hypothetical protein
MKLRDNNMQTPQQVILLDGAVEQELKFWSAFIYDHYQNWT